MDVSERDADVGGVTLTHTLTVEEIALALDNEATARAVIRHLPLHLRLAMASILLEPHDGKEFFGEQDVVDEAEARARALGVARELRARHRLMEAADFTGLAERHGKRALRILSLLPTPDQAHLHARIFGSPLGNGEGKSIVDLVKE